MNEKLEKALNDQINAELYSSYLYCAIAAYFDDINLTGFANWMKVQAEEEVIHTKKMYNFIYERDGKVLFSAIDAPPSKWDSPLDAFKFVYAHEQKVTGLINNLVDLAISESDHASNNFLQWFVAEQVEDEASASAVVKQLELIRENPQGLFMLDKELGQRVLTTTAA